jgi:tetraacyldisaccharide 4'-kinase
MKLPRAPDFWWRRYSPAAIALAPIGLVYGQITGHRMVQRGATSSIPVICIGNLVLGGAGKTPTAIEVANVCQKLGMRPGFLSRGYRGAEKGPLFISPAVHSAADVGDEALLLAQFAPTVVAVDRPDGAKLLASLGVNVVIMDDGFQNPSLNKDLALVVISGERGTGNGLVFPAGPLRAPLATQIRRADALVILGEGAPVDAGKWIRIAARAGRPTLRARVEPVRRRGLKRRPYLAFAGIADPAKFHASLTEAGAVIGYAMNFPDHHLFTEEDCEKILSEAKARDLVPICTEKDRVRLNRREGVAARLAATTETFPVRIRFDEPRLLLTLARDAIANHGSAYHREPAILRGAERARA